MRCILSEYSSCFQPGAQGRVFPFLLQLQPELPDNLTQGSLSHLRLQYLPALFQGPTEFGHLALVALGLQGLPAG